MGFNHPFWKPAHHGGGISATTERQLAQLRAHRERRARESMALRALHGSLISLAAILGTDVKDEAGASVGRLRDVVVHWTRTASYPRVTGIVVRIGGRDVVLGARWLEITPSSAVRVHSRSVFARAAERHPAEVALAHDVLDRQIVDLDGVQVVRPADVYLARVGDRVELVGIEVGVGALLRRLGSRHIRTRFTPARVIDWSTIRSFSPAHPDENRSRGRRSALAGHAGTGLVLDGPAGAVRHLRSSEIQAALRDAQVDQADRTP